MAITKKQKEFYDYIVAYNKEHGHSPTQKEIKDHFGLKSFGSVQKYLQYLNKEGLLESQWNQRRSLEIKSETPAESDSDQIPLLGLVAAGNPIEAIENPTNMISVPKYLLKGGFRYFALTVKGDSMIDAGILENDVLVCRSTKEARNGQIVVAVVNGEATVKTFSQQKKSIELLPSNKNYSPIVIDETIEDFKVVGNLVGLLRSY
ncbi:transcriptional repressor LexA [Bacteriovorax sp. PP10]|uniref:LexA repressor n=1 Tax=Bacteriovorax antarcticus TaxID=3088717 RepID=A0ABU5W1N0_9BACT|nr:transcriptional repressor LexA [Bacteriovorax sp. PP10]MEA9358538.1 transcriptional repressor LexA [Bacteriovorax sp. PP10]